MSGQAKGCIADEEIALTTGMVSLQRYRLTPEDKTGVPAQHRPLLRQQNIRWQIDYDALALAAAAFALSIWTFACA